MELTKTEISVLRQLHLQGFVKWGAMPKNKRVPLLKSLEERGLIEGLNLTEKGIRYSSYKDMNDFENFDKNKPIF